MDPLTIKYKHPTKTFSILKVRFDALNGPTKKKSPSNKIEGLGCAQGVWWICRNPSFECKIAPPDLLGKFLRALLMHRQ